MRRIKKLYFLSFLLAAMAATSASVAVGQGLVVFPVNIQMQPRQKATSITVTNRETASTSIQLRAYAWDQKSGQDVLLPSDEILVSPPLATIPAGATQVIRVVLRHAEDATEATYRLIIDQIPPPATPGQIAVVLKLSLPVFVQPTIRTSRRMEFHVSHQGQQLILVARNQGNTHEVFRNVVLTTKDGHKLKADTNGSPYVLAGATRRWPILADSSALAVGESVQADADVGPTKTKLEIPVSDDLRF